MDRAEGNEIFLRWVLFEISLKKDYEDKNAGEATMPVSLI